MPMRPQYPKTRKINKLLYPYRLDTHNQTVFSDIKTSVYVQLVVHTYMAIILH